MNIKLMARVGAAAIAAGLAGSTAGLASAASPITPFGQYTPHGDIATDTFIDPDGPGEMPGAPVEAGPSDGGMAGGDKFSPEVIAPAPFEITEGEAASPGFNAR